MNCKAIMVLAFALAALLAHVPLATHRASAQAHVPAFQLIVNAANPQSRVQREFVAHAFLRKVARWPHGATIQPVDQQSQSSVRRSFSSSMLQRTVPAVRSYWQQLIFTGRGLPPPELASDQDVVRYVARNPGALGYVSGGTDLGAVKVVSVN